MSAASFSRDWRVTCGEAQGAVVSTCMRSAASFSRDWRVTSTKAAQFPQDWLYSFKVDSQGKLFIPTPESPCSVKLVFNEEVLVFDSNLLGSYYIEHNKNQEEILFNIVNKISSAEDLKVPVRKCKVVSKDIDATIEGEDLKALVETMELAKLLRESRYR